MRKSKRLQLTARQHASQLIWFPQIEWWISQRVAMIK